MLTLALWLTTTATAWAAYSGGTGTKDDPYLIANANDLNKLAHHLNYQSTGYFDDKYFVQTADIDCSGWTYYDTWEVIGKDADHPFGGHYDGGGYSITGFTITTDGQYAGLFGYIKGGPYNGSEANTKIAEVHGVVLMNPTITVTANSSDQYAGAVVGYAGDCARAYDNTVIGGSVTFTGGSNYNTNNSYAGGLIGYFSNSNFPKLSGNKVSGTTVSGGGVCGGLVGYHSSYSTQLSGNFADANVSSVEYDLYQDQHTYGYRQGALAGYCNITSGGVTSVNYYHSRNGLTAYGNKTEWHAISAEPDNSWVSPLYTVTAPDGLTVSGTPTVSLNGTDYYAANATVTLTVADADHIISGTPTVSGTGASLGSVATDRKSMTVTIGTADVTVSATLLTIAGSCSSDGSVTWRMSDADGDGTYETLTLSGTGAVTSSPWAADFAASIQRVNIGSTDLTISGNPFSTLGAAAVIVVPTPAYAVNYSSAAYASKLRVALGNYLFSVTDEGGTAAYAIASEADLRNLAAAVNATNDISSGKTFRQTADIAMTGGNFARIGTGGSKYFQGTYDGQGHAISGLSVSNDYNYIGLFGLINGATVRNVLLVSPTATATTTGSGYSVSLGALIGQCGNSGGTNTVENCVVVSPTVSSSSTASDNNVGAIIGKIWGVTNVTNCYYYDNAHDYATVGWYDSDGHLTNVARARRITLGSGITAVSPAVSDPANGFQYGGSNYYREGLALTLTTTAGATVPDYYTQTVSANGNALSGTAYTVNATDGDATLTASVRSDGQQHEVSYVEADGTEHHVTATFLDGNEPVTSQYGSQYIDLAAGWYYVGTDIDYTGKCIRPQGAINLILGNGKTMHIGTDDNPTGKNGIDRGIMDLTIYGQSLDNATAGTLSYVGSGGGFDVYNYTQHSGNVSISHTSTWLTYGIDCYNATINGGTFNATGGKQGISTTTTGTVTINGGTVNASGTEYGIYAPSGTITLGWTNATDRITASSYGGTLAVATGQALITDADGNILTGTLAPAAVNGKTLAPFTGLELTANQAPDANYWTTFYCGNAGFDIDGNACAYTANYASGQLTLHKLGADGKTIPADCAVIIVGESDKVNLGVNLSAPAYNDVPKNNLRGVDVDTPTDDIKTDLNISSGTFYVLGMTVVGGEQHFGFHKYEGTEMAARKAFVLVNGTGAALARSLTMVFDDEATGIKTTDFTDYTDSEDAWYTLDGRRLQGKPAKSGIYMNNGKKIVIK